MPNSPHYQVHVTAAGTDYRLAVNVLSQLSPSELLFVVDEHFQHALTDRLATIEEGFTLLPKQPGTASLDFIRGNMFSRLDMRPLPPSLPGPDNDLSDRVAHYVERAGPRPTRSSMRSASAGGRSRATRTRSSGSSRATASTTST